MRQSYFLDFERPIKDLGDKIQELLRLSLNKTNVEDIDVSAAIQHLEKKQAALIHSTFQTLNSWQIVQLARHPERPHMQDYVEGIFEEFDPLQGDRHMSDDKAIMGGIARLDQQPVLVIGHQKGRSTRSKVYHNFGMPKPEGYRKALRLMHLAERFNLPILSFIDTPGAYPGMDAEERNQSEAIALNLQVLSELKTPIISTVIGEGGSGGALAIGVGDRTLMLQYSIYSVISPEGCASILWRDATKAAEAAEAMSLTAQKIKELGLIDGIVEEPLGGAHTSPAQMINSLKETLIHHLNELKLIPKETLIQQRYERLLSVGRFVS